MSKENMTSQPKGTPQESIGDDAQFLGLLYRYCGVDPKESGRRYEKLVAYIDSKLRAPADQAASVVPEKPFRWIICTGHGDRYSTIAPTGDFADKWIPLYRAPQQSLAPAAEDIDYVDCPACIGSRIRGEKRGVRCVNCEGTGSVAAEGQVSAAAPADFAKLLSAAEDALAEGNRGTSGRLILDRYSEESLREAVAKIRASEGQTETSAAIAMPVAPVSAINEAERLFYYRGWREAMEAVAAQSADKPAGGDHE